METCFVNLILTPYSWVRMILRKGLNPQLNQWVRRQSGQFGSTYVQANPICMGHNVIFAVASGHGKGGMVAGAHGRYRQRDPDWVVLSTGRSVEIPGHRDDYRGDCLFCHGE